MSGQDPEPSAGDELLRWVSEAGAGSWDRLRDACAYLTHKHNLARRPWTLATDLSALGHLDIDWHTRDWSVAPPALNLVPGLGLCVVLTGSRPYYVDRRYEEATDDLDVYPIQTRQDPAPAAKYAKCASVEAAEKVAERLNATFVVDPALQLVSAMRAVNEVLVERVPEPPLEDAQRFDPVTLRWRDDHGRQAGLYRVDLHGRPVHRRLDEHGYWSSIDLAAGQFLALQERAARAEPVVRWLPRRNERPECFEVRQELALPTLAERALTVSSGLAPERRGAWKRYLNVPRPLARRLTDLLLQRFSAEWGE